MDDTEKALLAAICADPTDDTARLVYCDWLEENAGEGPCTRIAGLRPGTMYLPCEIRGCEACNGTGRSSDGRQKRAEFIRLQIEIERVASECTCELCELRAYGRYNGIWNPAHNHLEHNGLYRKERRMWHQLFDGNQLQWCQISAPPTIITTQMESGYEQARANDVFAYLEPRLLIPNHGDIRLRVRRGFVEGMQLSWRQWMDWCDRITEKHPIRAVALTNPGEFASGPRFTTINDEANRLIRIVLEEETCDRKRRMHQMALSRHEIMMQRDEGHMVMQVAYRQMIQKFLNDFWPNITFQVPPHGDVPYSAVRNIRMGMVEIRQDPAGPLRPPDVLIT